MWDVRTIVDGWDTFELWVTQLAFPFQVLLVIVVLLPVCAVVATLVDRVTERFDTPSSKRARSVPPPGDDVS